MTIKIYKLCTAAALCCFLAPAFSEETGGTPDGETPAVEDVCASEEGRAKGLCNAYCEAMDCELGDEPNASPKACSKVKANYIEAKLKEGIEVSGLPCEATAECPCIELWSNGLGAGSPPDGGGTVTMPNSEAVQCIIPNPVINQSGRIYAAGFAEEGVLYCFDNTKCVGKGCTDPKPELETFPVDDKDAALQACTAYLETHCEGL